VLLPLSFSISKLMWGTRDTKHAPGENEARSLVKSSTEFTHHRRTMSRRLIVVLQQKVQQTWPKICIYSLRHRLMQLVESNIIVIVSYKKLPKVNAYKNKNTSDWFGKVLGEGSSTTKLLLRRLKTERSYLIFFKIDSSLPRTPITKLLSSEGYK